MKLSLEGDPSKPLDEDNILNESLLALRYYSARGKLVIKAIQNILDRAYAENKLMDDMGIT